MEMMHDRHQLLWVAALLQDWELAVVCDVASGFAQEPCPVSLATPVVRLEDVGVGEPEGLQELR